MRVSDAAFIVGLVDNDILDNGNSPLSYIIRTRSLILKKIFAFYIDLNLPIFAFQTEFFVVQTCLKLTM